VLIFFSQEFVIRDVQEEQFARFSPPELIKLAFFCALLEQTPHNSDKELVSRRYRLVKYFLEEITQVVPIESLHSAIAYSDDKEIVTFCKYLVYVKLAECKIPPSLSMWRNSVLYCLREESIDHQFILDTLDVVEMIFVSLVQFGNVLSAPTVEYLFKLVCTFGAQMVEQDILSPEGFCLLIKSPSKNLPVMLSNHSSTLRGLCDVSAGFPSAVISSVNLHYLLSKCSEIAPLEILREGRRKLTQSQTQALFSVQENEVHLNVITSIIVAFMREHVRVSLLENVMSLWKLTNLYVRLVPKFTKFCRIFLAADDSNDSNDEEFYKLIKSMADCVQQKLYENSTLVVESYVTRLQFLVSGVGNAFCLSEPCKEYFLEAELMHNCQQLTITRATPTETIVSKWDKLFKRTALFSVAKSFRPLIARWIRWSLMIHNLRHELAKLTAVGVVGLVNSGKSQLVNKLFQIKVCGYS